MIAFGWDAFDYQVAPLNDTSKRLVISTGRQIGKTEMAAIRGLYNAVWHDDSVTLILSPNQRQSNILFRRMKYFLNRNAVMPDDVRIPITESITRETQTVIELGNGAEIHSLPASEDGDNIRGFTAHMIIVDEAAKIKDDVYKVIRPMLLTTRGTLILQGSPKGMSNYFYKCYSEPTWKFSPYHFPSSVSPLISDEDIEEARLTLPDNEFRQEYLGEFISSVGVMFTPEEVDAAIRRTAIQRDFPFKAFEYYLGYDPARFGDDDGVGVILERRPMPEKSAEATLRGWKEWAAVKIIEVKNAPLTDQIRLIKQLHNVWNFKRIVVDATGMGGGVTDALVEDRLPVEGFQFSYKSKAEVYFNLKQIFENQNMLLPENAKMRKQLLELQREQSEKSGFIKIFHPRRGADDYPTALALAAWSGTRKRPSQVLFGRIPGVFS